VDRCKKAYDSVPHDWIAHCLGVFKVHEKIIQLLKKAMSLWSTKLTVDNLCLGTVDIGRGIIIIIIIMDR